MSDKSGKTGLSSGASWSLFSENTAFEEPDMIVERLGNSSHTTRLRPEDISKFGSCPSRQALQITTCRECNKTLILSSLQRHYEFKHSKLLSSVKPAPPKRCIPNTVSKNSMASFSKAKVLKGAGGGGCGGNGGGTKNFIRIEEVNPNEANVKIEEVPITIPHFEKKASKLKVSKLNLNKIVNDSNKQQQQQQQQTNPTATEQRTTNLLCSPSDSSNTTNSKGKSSSSKKSLQKMKEKEFEPDKHCGVWVAEAAKNCTRSLTCKTHALSLRRQVPGRSKEFDVLLAEHRARVKSQENNHTSSSSSHSTNKTPNHSPFGFEKINFPTVLTTESSNQKDSILKSTNGNNVNDKNTNDSSFYLDYVSTETLNTSNLPYKLHHPKPIKVNNFGGRRTDCNCALFTRRMDHFRSATASMLARYSCNMTNWKQTKDTNKEKKNFLGPKPALQDPLQNGIIYKQKAARKSGLKRHLSLNEVQGIHNDTAKRRNSTDINIVDPFTNNPSGGGTQQTARLNKTLQLTPNDQVSKTKDFSSYTTNKTNNLDVSVIDEFLASNLVNTPSDTTNYLNNKTTGTIETVDLTKSQPQQTLKSSLTQISNELLNSSMPSLGSAVTLNHTNMQGVTSVFSLQQQSSNHNKLVSAAPNVTITQGMIVSLPNAATVLRNNTALRANAETTLHSAASQNLTLKQILNKDQNNLLLTISNSGAVPSPVQETNTTSNNNSAYSISYSSFEQHQEPAPNITVTDSLSLSGVLQGHSVTTSATNKQQQQLQQHHFKQRMNNKVVNSQSEGSRLLQQLIVQQQQHNHEQQQRFDNNAISATSVATGIVSQTAGNLQRVVAQHQQHHLQQQQQNTLTVNAAASGGSGQTIKPLQRIHIQQLNQSQTGQVASASAQPFITTMQHHAHANAFSQQILPKLPTLPQNFNAQLVSQATAVNQLQQQQQQTQHGGTIS